MGAGNGEVGGGAVRSKIGKIVQAKASAWRFELNRALLSCRTESLHTDAIVATSKNVYRGRILGAACGGTG